MNKANWAILIAIMLIISVLILYMCGIGIGMMLLIIMNGIPEIKAAPLLFVFALVVFGVSVLFSTQFGWIFVKMRGVEIPFMQVVGVSAGVNAALILVTLLVVLIVKMTG